MCGGFFTWNRSCAKKKELEEEKREFKTTWKKNDIYKAAVETRWVLFCQCATVHISSTCIITYISSANSKCSRLQGVHFPLRLMPSCTFHMFERGKKIRHSGGGLQGWNRDQAGSSIEPFVTSQMVLGSRLPHFLEVASHFWGVR